MKSTVKTIISILIIAFISSISYSQNNNNNELFEILKIKDSLLFQISFNKCDLTVLDTLIANDLEFYHDKGGIINSKEEFINLMKNGLCKENNPYKSRRELIKGSLKVFPLYNNGKLYGALQNGEHRFFETYKGKETPKSFAKFSHLWLIENNQWIIKRIISYDHKMKPIKK